MTDHDNLARRHSRCFFQADPRKAGSGRPLFAGALAAGDHIPPGTPLLTSDPPELLPGSFVDEELGQHHSDLLFRFRLRAGGHLLLYVVIEHKSGPDSLARLQILRYVVRFLTRWVHQRQDSGLSTLPLPLIVPMLVYHGQDGWKASAEFQDLFAPLPESLAQKSNGALTFTRRSLG